MSVLILIPARLAATRLPGKPLADINGAPMIVHVARRARESGLGGVVVATDSDEIAAAVRADGFEAAMTRADQQSGSDRIFEALAALDPEGRVDTVVNVQGDLPTIDPKIIEAPSACRSSKRSFAGSRRASSRRAMRPCSSTRRLSSRLP